MNDATETPLPIPSNNVPPEAVPPAPVPTPPRPELVPAEPIPPAPAVVVGPEQALTGEPFKPPTEIRLKTKEWYRQNLDWSKTNRQLSKEAGVTHQRIGQLRKELFPDGKIPPAPVSPEPVVLPGERPTFDDLEPTGEAAPPAALAPAPVVDYQGMSEMVFDLSTGALTKIFGPEWQPTDAKEREAVVTALKNYAQSKQLPDIPPGLMLCIVVAIYAAPRVQAPPTRNKLGLAWAWLKVKLFKRKPKAPPIVQIHEK